MEQIAAVFASFLVKQLNLDSEQQDVLQFGALTAILHLSSVLTVTIVAAFTGTIIPVLVVTVIIMVVRHASGGPHVQTPGRCYVTSTAALLVLAYTGAAWGPSYAALPLFGRLSWAITASLLGMAGLYRYAPVEAPRRPLSPTHRANMRRLSLRLGALVSLLVVIGAITGSALTVPAVLGFLFQISTLTPTGCSAVNFIDGRLTAEGRDL